MSSSQQTSPTSGPVPLQALVEDSLDRLCKIYTSATSLTIEQVLQQVVYPMARDPTVTGERMIKEAAQTAKETPKAPHLILSPAAIALAYHSQCTRSLREGDREAAWAYMAQCRWWTATAIVVRQSPQLSAQIVTEARSEMASLGARAKAERWEPMRAEAYRLVRERFVRVGPWPSKRNAAIQIAPVVLKLAQSKGLTMSEYQITTTLQDWLAQMPDREDLFLEKKKKKTVQIAR